MYETVHYCSWYSWFQETRNPSSSGLGRKEFLNSVVERSMNQSDGERSGFQLSPGSYWNKGLEQDRISVSLFLGFILSVERSSPDGR